MTLVVEVTLDRKIPIYLTGEIVVVEVRVHNEGKARERLAWGSVQLTSDRTFGRRKVLEGHTGTSISHSASNVFSSLPSVIFCDLDVAPSHSKTFTCQIILPVDGLPPSFKGHYLRYTNRITVGVARIRSTVRMLHVSLRVMQSVGLDCKQPSVAADPFLPVMASLPTVSQLVTSTVDVITAPRKPSLFSLTNSQGKIASLTLYKKAFRLGEDVIGHVSFHDSSLRTIHMHCVVETVESLSDEVVTSDAQPFIQLQGTDDRFCASLQDCHFRIAIPMTASPSFHTQTVHYKWRLRFEFSIVDDIGLELNEEDATLLLSPLDITRERLSWSTDILVLPCTPYNAALTEEHLVSHSVLSL